MTTPPDMRLPPRFDRDAILARLDRVLDPELDESVLALGFVASVHGDSEGELTVELRLPTYWCAANFSYLMASDVQRELGQVDGVSRVSVRLPEHFAADAIESGAGPGKSFAEAFPEGGPDTLEQTRRLFLHKGFFTRQEKLLRELKQAGLSFQEIAGLRVGNITAGVDSRIAERYLERRRELGLDCSDSSHLIVDVKGAVVSPDDLETYYIRARTTRLSMEASGSLCSALLEARQTNRSPVPTVPSPRGRGLG
jgi:metal-sulfur cluster biosynthetic enzyme